MAERTGLRDQTGKASAGLVLGLPPDTLAAFAAACRLTEPEAAALTLADRAGTLLAQPGRRRNGSLQQAATAAWISPGRTRYCPGCLRGDSTTPGYWRASWQLPWHFACLRHGNYLADVCPSCEAEPGLARPDSPFGSLVPSSGVNGLAFDACRLRIAADRHGGLCGHRLSDPGDYPLPADPVVLAAQRRLDRLLGLHSTADPDPAPTLAGEPISLPLWVLALQGVVCLVRAASGLPGAPPVPPPLLSLATFLRLPSTPDSELARLLHPNTPPLDAPSAAALTAVALRVLDAPTRDDLDDRLAPYREPVREHRPRMWKSWLRQYPDDSVKRLLKRHRRWGSLAAATRTPSSSHNDNAGLRGRHLAQRIPPPHDRLLTPYRHLAVSDTGLHRATSVLLWQRLEGAPRRADAAAALDYADPGAVDQTVSRLQRLLAADGLTAAYTATLDQLQAALAAAPRVDWASRRAALQGWTVPPDEWTALKAQLLPLQKRDGRQPDWDLRRLVISQIVWEDLTQAEPHGSPAFAEVGPNPKARVRLRNISQQFRAHVADGTLVGFDAVITTYRQRVSARFDAPDRRTCS